MKRLTNKLPSLKFKQPLLLFVVILGFGAIGSYILITSHAATPVVSIQPESGSVASPAMVVSDSSASNSAGIKFIAAPPVTTGGNALYEPADGKAYIGLATSSHNNYVTNFDVATGIATHPAIFEDYTPADGDMINQFNNIGYGSVTGAEPALAGMTPMVSWNLTMSNNVITNGSQDAYITKMANEAKTFGKPVFIRLNWEMNGGWYNGYDQKGGTTPAMFVASWQHVHDIFHAIAPNAAFVWCPNVGEFSDTSGVKVPNENWYPGDSYVDWVGVDAYPEYDSNPPNVVTKSYGLNWFASFSASHNKPLVVGEYGMREQSGTTAKADSSTTFDVIFGWANANPNTVKALIYFDFGSNHRLESEPPTGTANNPLGLAAYRSYTVGNNRYLYSVPGS
jgi:hypothetical protein